MESTEQYLDQPYSVVVVRTPTVDGGKTYLALNRELPGCMSQGETPEAAKTNLRDARKMFIRDMLAHGEKVPSPHVIMALLDMAEPAAKGRAVTARALARAAADFGSLELRELVPA